MVWANPPYACTFGTDHAIRAHLFFGSICAHAPRTAGTHAHPVKLI